MIVPVNSRLSYSYGRHRKMDDFKWPAIMFIGIALAGALMVGLAGAETFDSERTKQYKACVAVEGHEACKGILD